jgi:hypothetical protein
MTTEAQKRATQKWRATHRQTYNKYQLDLTKKYNQKNADKIKEYNRNKYLYDKQCKIFRNILLD